MRLPLPTMTKSCDNLRLRTQATTDPMYIPHRTHSDAIRPRCPLLSLALPCCPLLSLAVPCSNPFPLLLPPALPLPVLILLLPPSCPLLFHLFSDPFPLPRTCHLPPPPPHQRRLPWSHRWRLPGRCQQCPGGRTSSLNSRRAVVAAAAAAAVALAALSS